MKVRFYFENHNATIEIPDSELEGLDAIDTDVLIEDKFNHWLTHHFDAGWEIIDEEETP